MKKRVHEIAKAKGLTSKEVLAALNSAGIEVTAAASSVEEDEALKALAGADGGAGASPAPAVKGAAKSKGAAQAKPKAAAAKSRRPRESAGDGS